MSTDPQPSFEQALKELEDIVRKLESGELSLDDADPVLAGAVAWLFGSEAHGLSAAVSAAADRRITIPMTGGAESLNVATAAAICLYQTARAQRQQEKQAQKQA
jgi:TrmH family RNA methyltransferase